MINEDKNRVEFYDIESGSLTGVVPVGSRPMDGDLTLDGNTLLVANYMSTFLSLVNLDTQTVEATIAADENRRPRMVLALTDTLALLYTAIEPIGSPPEGGSHQVVNLKTRTATKVLEVPATVHVWHAGPGPYFYHSADGYSWGGAALFELTTTSVSIVYEYHPYGFTYGEQKLVCNPQGTRIVYLDDLMTRDFQLLGDLGISLDHFKTFDQSGRLLIAVKSSASNLSVIDTDSLQEFDTIALPPGQSLVGKLAMSADNGTLFAHTNSGISVVRLQTAPGPADLAVQDFAIGTISLTHERPIPLSGKIENIGEQATPCEFWIEFHCSPNADFSPPVYYLCDSILVSQDLGPGESLDLDAVERTVYDLGQIPPGYYYIRVSADSLNFIGEENEANNRALIGPIAIGEMAVKSWEFYQ